jgi:hypothetical protein
MTIEVEDGTGKANAECFASVTYCDAYHDARGNTTWATLTTQEKEEALRRSTDYMEQAYGMRYKGLKKTTTQALSWPRSYVDRENAWEYFGEVYYPDDTVPVEVKRANAELAWRAAAGELLPDLSQGVKREKVDVLEVEYDNYSPQSPRYKAIDMMLKPFLMYSSTALKVIRV